MIEDRSQVITYTKSGTKTVKTRVGDGLFTKLKTFKNGKRELELYNYDEQLIRMEL